VSDAWKEIAGGNSKPRKIHITVEYEALVDSTVIEILKQIDQIEKESERVKKVMDYARETGSSTSETVLWNVLDNLHYKKRDLIHQLLSISKIKSYAFKYE